MKVFVTKASDWSFEKVREYDSLKECVDSLLNDKYVPALVISRPKHPGCEYDVEIYDSWRE